MRRVLPFIAAFACAGVAMAMPAEARYCVKSRLDKGAWFVAKVEMYIDKREKPTDSPKMYTDTYTIGAGQEACSDEATGTTISISGISVNVPYLYFHSGRITGDCRIDIWGTTIKMYYNDQGPCGQLYNAYFVERGIP